MKTKIGEGMGKGGAVVALAAAVVMLGAGGSFGQNSQNYLWIGGSGGGEVTFYDFHSDRSNPEFEQPHGKVSGCSDNDRTNLCIRKGMVASTLDADNKPTLGPTPYRNYGIGRWFRSWENDRKGPYNQGSKIAPVYDPAPGVRVAGNDNNEWSATVRYIEDRDVGHDTSFKNIVFKDSLRFTLTNATTAMYRFDRRGNDNGFFPLDNKGFGNEWMYNGSTPSHNFAFTMELSFEFQAKSGMSFNFSGDDDVWVFINSTLALDIGGIHSEQSESFKLQDVPVPGGIVNGQKYKLRVFYAERHSTASNILIETNMVAPPDGIGISKESNTSDNVVSGNNGSVDKAADDSLRLYSVVKDEEGKIMNPETDYSCANVTWTINDKVVGTGCSILVKDSVANAAGVEIKATLRNPADNSTKEGKTTMNVKALRPAYICIQKDSLPYPSSTNKAKTNDDINFGSNSEVPVYAVLRDKYGNFVAYADYRSSNGNNNTWWSSNGGNNAGAGWVSDTAIAWMGSENAKSDKATGSRIVIHKGFLGEGSSGELTVRYVACTSAGCDTLVSTVMIGSKNEGKLSIGPNPFVSGPNGKPLSETLKSPPGGKGGDVLKFYENVIKLSVGGGTGDGKNVSGVLIAADAAGKLKEGKTGEYGRVVIYDAVGNVVKRAVLYQAGRSSSFGFVWDGRNTSGRFVGPGAYLVRVTGTVEKDGSAFALQRMIGVKK